MFGLLIAISGGLTGQKTGETAGPTFCEYCRIRIDTTILVSTISLYSVPFLWVFQLLAFA